MGSAGRLCERLLECGVLFLLLVTPLALATVHPLTYSCAETLVFVLALLWLIRSMALRRERRWAGPFAPASSPPVPLGVLVCFALFLGLLVLQIVNLPESVRALLSPRASALDLQMTRDIPPEIALSLPYRATLSLYPFYSKVEIGKIVSFVALFLIVAINYSDKRAIRRCLSFMVLVGGIVSLVGIAQHITGTKKIYWTWSSELGGTSFGPFPNRNDFAAYLDILIPIAIVLLFTRRDEDSWARRPLLLSSVEPRVLDSIAAALSRIGIGICLALMTTSLLMSGSRAGAIGLGVSLITMIALLLANRTGRKRLAGVVFAITVCVFLGLFVSGETLMDRFAGLPSERKDRFWIWRDSVKVVRDFPLVGAGLGTFASIFPAYKANPTTSRLINHAHNEYLQILLETGVVGTGVLVIAAAMLLGRFVRAARSSNGYALGWPVVGILCGLVGVMAHAVFALCIRIPANAYLIAAAAGLGLGCTAFGPGDSAPGAGAPGHAGFHPAEPVRLPVSPSPQAWRFPIILPLLVTAGMGLVVFAGWRSFAAGDAIQRMRLAEEANAPVLEQLRWISKAVARDPSMARSYSEAARRYFLLAGSPLIAVREFDNAPPAAADLCARAVLNYQKAIRTQPTHAEHYSLLAYFYAWDPRLNQAQRMVRTIAAFQRAIYLAPNNDAHWIHLGAFCEAMGDHARALACYKAALRLRVMPLAAVVTAAAQHGATGRDIAGILPPNPEYYLDAARVTTGWQKGEVSRELTEMAIQFPAARTGAAALRVADNYLLLGDGPAAARWLTACLAQSPGDADLRWRLVKAYLGGGQMDKAIEEARRLTGDHPDAADNYALLAQCLLAKGASDAAVEQYRKAMRLRPAEIRYVAALCDLLRSRQRLKEASDVAEQFCRAMPDSSQGHALLASLRASQGCLDEALSEYNRALFLDPGNAQYRDARNEVLKLKAQEKAK